MNARSRISPGGDHDATILMWRMGAPRRAFWVTLIGALAFSLALPLLTLWRGSAAGLVAHACMWPAAPRAGTPAQVLVVIPPSEESSVRDGSPTVLVEATMPGMAMSPEQASVNDPPQRMQGEDVFMASLAVPMPGTWRAQVTIRALGRPVWRSTLTFQARAGGWDALPLSTQAAGAGSFCAATGQIASRVT